MWDNIAEKIKPVADKKALKSYTNGEAYRRVCAAMRRIKIFIIRPISSTRSLYCIANNEDPDHTVRMRRQA